MAWGCVSSESPPWCGGADSEGEQEGELCWSSAPEPSLGRAGGVGGGEMPTTGKVFRPHVGSTDTGLGSPGAARPHTCCAGALRLGRGIWVWWRVEVLSCLHLLPSLSLSFFTESKGIRPSAPPANFQPERQGSAQRLPGPGSQDRGARAAMV